MITEVSWDWGEINKANDAVITPADNFLKTIFLEF